MLNFSSFIKSFFVLLIIFGVLYAATEFSPTLRSKAEGVLGVQMQAEPVQDLPDKLQEDVTTSLEDAKEKGLETSVEDVIGVASRTKKIIHDYQIVQKDIQKAVDDFFKDQEK